MRFLDNVIFLASDTMAFLDRVHVLQWFSWVTARVVLCVSRIPVKIYPRNSLVTNIQNYIASDDSAGLRLKTSTCLVKKMIGKHTSCTLMIITECTICARTRRWIQPEYNVASSGRSSLPQIHCCLNNISKMVLTCLVAASTKFSDQTWTPEILEDRKVAGKFGSQRSGSVPLPRIILGCTKHTA